ncbi:MAG: zinc ribbon domain-containing protein, partial [Candidatus Omnitrophica bacterium]|nr:zinc ribbon domain-containing protein [Candidatus Omnitrophota bacterium]
MPIYEYEPDGESVCPFCCRGFELIQKISDPPLAECPECGEACKR